MSDLNQLYFRAQTRLRMWRARASLILDPVRVVHQFVFPRLLDLERRCRELEARCLELEARLNQVQRRP